MKKYDAVIIGGGIMGVFAARALALKGVAVAIIERDALFNLYSASGGITRSFRQDYLDPMYARMAEEARRLWVKFERDTDIEALKPCGCLNLWDPRLKLAWEDSYAAKCAVTIQEAGIEFEDMARPKLSPKFNCERGTLDLGGGMLALPAVQDALLLDIRELGVTILEGQNIQGINLTGNEVRISLKTEVLTAQKIIITTGRWINETLDRIEGVRLPRYQLLLDRPLASVYCLPENAAAYSVERFPVFACLDIGIYGHPILDGRTRGVKVGMFRPDPKIGADTSWTIERFLETFMPELARCPREPVRDADLCCYDHTSDGDFIVGALAERIIVATGFCGTGYKFAPLIGEMLSKLADAEERRPCLDRFDPWRFDAKRNL